MNLRLNQLLSRARDLDAQYGKAMYGVRDLRVWVLATRNPCSESVNVHAHMHGWLAISQVDQPVHGTGKKTLGKVSPGVFCRIRDGPCPGFYSSPDSVTSKVKPLKPWLKLMVCCPSRLPCNVS